MSPFIFAQTDARQTLVKQLNYTQTFSSRFEQKVLDESGQVLQKSSGELWFKKNPALFYWNVLSPAPQKMWYRNNQFIMLDVQLEQATIKKVSDTNDPNLLPVMLLAGNADKALQNFSVEKINDSYILTPSKKSKLANELLIRLVLELDKQGVVKNIRFQTTLGQMTDIAFVDAKVNQALNSLLFYQALPKGVDIVTE